MKFGVQIKPRAITDLEEIHAHISKDSIDAADRLIALLTDGIESLDEFPLRYVLAPESKESSLELRHMIVGNYRVIYSVVMDFVIVCGVVHAARSINPFDML